MWSVFVHWSLTITSRRKLQKDAPVPAHVCSEPEEATTQNALFRVQICNDAKLTPQYIYMYAYVPYCSSSSSGTGPSPVDLHVLSGVFTYFQLNIPLCIDMCQFSSKWAVCQARGKMKCPPDNPSSCQASKTVFRNTVYYIRFHFSGWCKINTISNISLTVCSSNPCHIRVMPLDFVLQYFSKHRSISEKTLRYLVTVKLFSLKDASAKYQ